MSYSETSAKENQNVEETFQMLAQQILESELDEELSPTVAGQTDDTPNIVLHNSDGQASKDYEPENPKNNCCSKK